MQEYTKINNLNDEQLTVELKVPQMGEGLREVRVVKLLKQEGEVIKEDEIIYEMETEKSLVEIESPYNGHIEKWFAKEGDMLEVGSVLGIIKLPKNSKP